MKTFDEWSILDNEFKRLSDSLQNAIESSLSCSEGFSREKVNELLNSTDELEFVEVVERIGIRAMDYKDSIILTYLKELVDLARMKAENYNRIDTV